MQFYELSRHPRVRVRKAGGPDPQGRAVVYWMQRAQRAADNPALDLAIQAANALDKPRPQAAALASRNARGWRKSRSLVERGPARAAEQKFDSLGGTTLGNLRGDSADSCGVRNGTSAARMRRPRSAAICSKICRPLRIAGPGMSNQTLSCSGKAAAATS
jgi:hypothetical protein